jgi:TonB-dependent SusC/RagA subfamily outer membrane receptor
VVDLFSTARMLQAVTIEAKRIERVSADKKHLMSDSHVDGDFLRATNATDLLTALRGRIPGLQIFYFKDPATLQPSRFIGFAGSTTWFGMQEALVEIDGVMLQNFGDQTVADQLANMTVNDIESVDVLRFGSASAYGARAANGVIVIKTRLGNSGTSGKRVIDRKKLQSVRMLGYSIAKEFTSPDYSEHTSGDDRVDYRSTIYWNPLLVSDGKEPLSVSFYAADLPTRYRIVVEGVTADGQPIRGEKIIVVTGKK